MKAKSVIPAVLSLFLVFTTSSFTSHAAFDDGNEKKYLPKELRKVRFGMSFEEVSALKKGLTETEQDYDFRKVYQEQVGLKGIASLVYYFDADEGIGLYEVIVIYDSESIRDKEAGKLLGSPNFKGKEWKMDIGEDYDLYAWTFQNKLVFAVDMKGTEWEGGM